MLDTESPAKRKRVSTPASALDSGAFGADAYNPKAYGAMNGSDSAPRYPRLDTAAKKSLSQLTEDAQVRLFVARKGLFGLSLRTTAMLAVALLAVVTTISTVIVLSSDGSDAPSQPEASLHTAPVATSAGSARAPADVTDSELVESDIENTDAQVADAHPVARERSDTDFKPSGLLDAPPTTITATATKSAAVNDTKPTHAANSAPKVKQSSDEDRSVRYRNLRTTLKRDLASLRIVDAAATARALAALNEPMDWEAHRWAARALRLNGDLEEAAELYALYAKMFPTNRYSARAKLWVQSLRRRIEQKNESASRALDNEKPAREAVTEQTVSVITNK